MITVLKERHPYLSLGRVCRLFGISRQAYYQRMEYLADYRMETNMLLKEIALIRASHPRIGGRKLYLMLEDFMLEHSIKMGRDGFFDLLSENGLLVRRRKRSVRTTQSSHWLRKWPNLIRELAPSRPNQLWVSDITYWKLDSGKYCYISLLTDAYSHKLLGYHVSDSLSAVNTLAALQMALDTLPSGHAGLIHHSDRGVQYCSQTYVQLLQKHHITISMTENGDPLENAVAERINGILKDEYLLNYQTADLSTARQHLDKAVQLYNHERPHMSIGNLTPAYVHQNPGLVQPENIWRKKQT